MPAVPAPPWPARPGASGRRGGGRQGGAGRGARAGRADGATSRPSGRPRPKARTSTARRRRFGRPRGAVGSSGGRRAGRGRARASGSSRRPTGTRASSPARTARPGHVPAPTALSRVPLHRPGRHRRRHPRRPGDGRPGRPQGLLRRPEGRRATLTQGDKPRFIAQVHHVGRRRAQVDLKLTIYAGGRESVYPQDGRRQGRRRRGGPLRAVRGPRRRRRPADAHGRRWARRTTSWSAEVPIRPWGVQAFASASGTASDDATAFVGLPPGRAYESPEMLVVVSPTLRRMLVELALGRDAYPLDAPRRGPASPAAARHDGRPRRRPAGGDLGPGLPADRPGRRRPRGRPADRPHPGARRRADHAPERGRRLALGRRREGRGQGRAERPADLGAGRLGPGLGRAAGPADRRRRPSTRRRPT